VLREKWILDFNRAYNPWCAYSEKYTCPFVPPEKCLEVLIHAGEKIINMRERMLNKNISEEDVC
jgi:uncharacterized protein (DUF1684 family)